MPKKQAPNQEPVEAPKGVFTRFTDYVNASRLELRKVTWPTMIETKKVSFSVFIFVVIMAVLLGLVDLGLSSLIKVVLS